MNDEEFTSDFKKAIRAATRSETHFAVIPKEHWSYPPGVNLTFAALERQRMVDDDVIYGGKLVAVIRRTNLTFGLQEAKRTDICVDSTAGSSIDRKCWSRSTITGGSSQVLSLLAT